MGKAHAVPPPLHDQSLPRDAPADGHRSEAITAQVSTCSITLPLVWLMLLSAMQTALCDLTRSMKMLRIAFPWEQVASSAILHLSSTRRKVSLLHAQKIANSMSS